MYSFDVSVVIISWKMKDFLDKCLSSIFKYTEGIKFEVIIIDNNSEDGTSELISKKFSEVKLIKNNKNKGVAPARNQGIKIAKGKYILILDADTELIENSIRYLYEYMEEDKKCGIVGAKLIDSNGTLQYSCKRFPNLKALIFRRLEGISLIRYSSTLKYHTMAEWDHNEIRKVDYLIGACQFIRNDVIKEIGGYDEKIFYGPEDIDFCLRIWNRCWKVIYFPFTKIVHHEQRITKKKIISKVSIKHLMGIIYIYMKYNGKLKITRK